MPKVHVCSVCDGSIDEDREKYIDLSETQQGGRIYEEGQELVHLACYEDETAVPVNKLVPANKPAVKSVA